MQEHNDCGGDAAAYVLGALEPAEAEAFARHMAGCIVCRDEVASLRQMPDVLATAVPQYAAPVELRERIMATVRAEAHHPATGRERAADQERARSRSRPRAPVASARWRPLVPLAFALVAAVAVFFAVRGTQTTSPQPRIIQADLGSAAVRLAGTHADLIVHHLPALPTGRVYELWIKRGRQPPVATNTLFTVNTGGAGDVGVPGSVSGVTEIMVTPEPAGGTSVPTHAPVIDVRI